MKNLATIQRITEFKKHPNADRLNLAKVLGWQCVTASDYEVGDLCVYIQIDTTVPRAEWSDFLFKEDEERARLRSIKLRGEISQGLILPLDVLDLNKGMDGTMEADSFFHDGDEWVIKEGVDVTEVLGIEKYIKPVPTNLAGEVVGQFPTALAAKTDEERVQNIPEILNELKGKAVYITCKMDGTSATYIKQDGKLRVCSRNLELKENDTNAYWILAKKYDLENKMEEGEVIQAELCGPGIQKNHSGETEKKLFAFNHGVVEGRQYDGYWGVKNFCDRTDVPMVPLVEWIETPPGFQYTLEELLELADSVKYSNGSQAEGIVIRPIEEMKSDVLQDRLSFKVISNKYAVKHGE